jgi:hypothetical protein
MNSLRRVVFNLTNQDAFVQARASAVNTGLPGAVFRFASLQQGGLPAAFDQPDSFAPWAETFYVREDVPSPRTTSHVSEQTRHLAIAAQSIYFVPGSGTLDVRVIKLTPRLSFKYVYGRSCTTIAHTLAAQYPRRSHSRFPVSAYRRLRAHPPNRTSSGPRGTLPHAQTRRLV